VGLSTAGKLVAQTPPSSASRLSRGCADAPHGAHRACEFPRTRLLAGWSLARIPWAAVGGWCRPRLPGGLEAARLELADGLLPLAPEQRLPFIPRPRGRAHDVYTPTCSASVQPAWPTSAYPGHYPGPWLLGPSYHSPGFRFGTSPYSAP